MNSNRIPLVVGVTGHRDLRDEDRPRLEAEVAKILTGLRAEYASTPLLVLSSLAEGADQLVARVALQCGAQVAAPLPMPVEEYRKDFATETSQREFADLLGHSALSFVLPYNAGVTAENIGDAAHRAGQYAKVGQYILRHGQILLALWDGNMEEKTGGTSQIVRQKRAGFSVTEMPERMPLNPPDSGTVFHLVTPRSVNPAPVDAFQLKKYYSSDPYFEEFPVPRVARESPEKIFAALLKRTDTFNQDVERLAGPLAEKFEKSRLSLVPDRGLGAAEGNLAGLLAPFAAADVLASHFQKKREWSLAQVCFLALEAPVCLAAYHTVDAQHSARGLTCLILFFIALCWAFFVYLRAKRHAYETKHLDYRALAEGMKVLYFWRLAGIHDDVGAQYLRKQRSEIDWIRLAVRAVDLQTAGRAGPDEPPYAWIETHWMEAQVRYFARSMEKNTRYADGCELAARVCVKAGVVMAAIMLGTHTVYFLEGGALPEEVTHYFHDLSVVIVGSLAMGGSVTAYAEKLAFAQLSKQYAQMHRLFAIAVKECRASLRQGDRDHVRSIIRRLGHEALRENGDWVLLHRERPMELKLGG